MAKKLDLPKEEMLAFCREQASIERKIRCEEREKEAQKRE